MFGGETQILRILSMLQKDSAEKEANLCLQVWTAQPWEVGVFFPQAIYHQSHSSFNVWL